MAMHVSISCSARRMCDWASTPVTTCSFTPSAIVPGRKHTRCSIVVPGNAPSNVATHTLPFERRFASRSSIALMLSVYIRLYLGFDFDSSTHALSSYSYHESPMPPIDTRLLALRPVSGLIYVGYRPFTGTSSLSKKPVTCSANREKLWSLVSCVSLWNSIAMVPISARIRFRWVQFGTSPRPLFGLTAEIGKPERVSLKA
mmetsp:Transcript_33609/g.81422  ORF Transcript_33609/g.81422 Transcript_33609/m.81422 type:complete len:201 (-) Transcript_33609:462-1064(-)